MITPEHEHILAVKMVILIAKPSKCDLKKLFTEWSGLPCRQIILKIVCVAFGFIENSLKASKWLFLEAVYVCVCNDDSQSSICDQVRISHRQTCEEGRCQQELSPAVQGQHEPQCELCPLMSGALMRFS